jgi:DNA-binding transcriptional MocR family regulator
MQFFRGAKSSAELVNRLRKAVADGKLAAGSRLPSQRRLAYDLGIAVGTATRAYQIAEREGLIVSYVGRGSFIAHTGASGTFCRAPAGNAIDLSADLPLEHLNPSLGAGLRELALDPAVDTLTHYFDDGRDARHREIAVGWAARFGFKAKADDIAFCAGSQHAILCALAAICRPGDAVMAEEFSYPGFRGAAELLSLHVEPVTIDAQGIVPAAIEAICKTAKPRALYLTPSVQNPTNAPLNPARRAIVARLAEQYDFIVIEDVVRPAAGLPEPIAALAPDRTLFIAGVSKTLGGGLRVSCLAAPAALRDKLAGAIWASQHIASPLLAAVAMRMIENGAADRVLAAKEKEAARRRALVERHLGVFDARTHPVSTFAWLKLPAGWSNAAAVMALAGRGIAVAPSDAFWNGRTPPPDALRICYGAAKTAEALDAALADIADVLARKPVPIRL